MDILKKLRALLNERGWTEYKLAKECGLSESTISNIYKRNSVPSFPTLEAICKGFGITLAQFFAEGEMIELHRKQENYLIPGLLLRRIKRLLFLI